MSMFFIREISVSLTLMTGSLIGYFSVQDRTLKENVTSKEDINEIFQQGETTDLNSTLKVCPILLVNPVRYPNVCENSTVRILQKNVDTLDFRVSKTISFNITEPREALTQYIRETLPALAGENALNLGHQYCPARGFQNLGNVLIPHSPAVMSSKVPTVIAPVCVSKEEIISEISKSFCIPDRSVKRKRWREECDCYFKILKSLHRADKIQDTKTRYNQRLFLIRHFFIRWLINSISLVFDIENVKDKFANPCEVCETTQRASSNKILRPTTASKQSNCEKMNLAFHCMLFTSAPLHLFVCLLKKFLDAYRAKIK